MGYFQPLSHSRDSCLSSKLLTLGTAHASTALLSLNRNSPLSLRAEEQKCTTMHRICSLCSYVLIYYPYVYTTARLGIFLRQKDIYKACDCVSINPFPLRGLPLSRIRSQGQKRLPTTKEYVLMYLCLNILPICLQQRTL